MRSGHKTVFDVFTPACGVCHLHRRVTLLCSIPTTSADWTLPHPRDLVFDAFKAAVPRWCLTPRCISDSISDISSTVLYGRVTVNFARHLRTMASTRKYVTALLLVVIVLAVHATAAQAAGNGASRKLRVSCPLSARPPLPSAVPWALYNAQQIFFS